MNKEELFKFYERQYFHEIDMREKLNSRLQLPLAALLALSGFLGYMLQNKNPDIGGGPSMIFWIFYLAALTSIGCALYFFRKSWFGPTDKLLPTAKTIEEYRKQLVDLYKDYENSEELVEKGLKESLYNYYVEFSSANTTNNDARSYNIYRTTVSLTVAMVLAFLTFLPYYFFRMDKSFGLEVQKVEITKPAAIKK